jgi:hypothetical protein
MKALSESGAVTGISPSRATFLQQAGISLSKAIVECFENVSVIINKSD